MSRNEDIDVDRILREAARQSWERVDAELLPVTEETLARLRARLRTEEASDGE